MHFYEIIKELSKDKEILLFVDMDGVIAAYEYGKPLNFTNKRPLATNIEKIKMISEINNIELHVLSVCREDSQIEEKKNWLKIYAPFFKDENVHILSKHGNRENSSSIMKMTFIKEYKTNKQMAIIDDDIRVLKAVDANVDNILLFQDSELID